MHLRVEQNTQDLSTEQEVKEENSLNAGFARDGFFEETCIYLLLYSLRWARAVRYVINGIGCALLKLLNTQ
jgi:hypothetical protein